MINIENVWFAYTGQNYVLKNLNLHVNEGDYISIVGDNGCGKSTLMRVLLGFLKPSRGEVKIFSQTIGYVPQKHDYSNSAFPITVEEVLHSYGKLLRIKDRHRIDEVLRFVGMSDYRHSLMGNLSGGQTQKILIARALLGRPGLMVLDEPSTGVDMDSQKEIYSLIKKLSVEEKMTVLSVEHNIEAAIYNSTKIFHMKDGHGHVCSPEKYTAEYLTTGGKK